MEYVGAHSNFSELKAKKHGSGIGGGGGDGDNFGKEFMGAGMGGGDGGAGGDNDFDEDQGKEFQDLYVYWRFDEGKGLKSEDLSNYERNAEIQMAGGNDSLKEPAVWTLLDDGEPVQILGKI